MGKRDLKADLAGLTGDWGVHESDWFRANGVEIAKHAIERVLYMEELVKELVQELENVACFIETMEYRHVSESVGKDFVGYKCDGNSHWIGDVLGDIEIMVNKAKEVLGDE